MKPKQFCAKCDGTGRIMVETPFEDRCYSSTSSGEFNGPTEVDCDWCYGKGYTLVQK